MGDGCGHYFGYHETVISPAFSTTNGLSDNSFFVFDCEFGISTSHSELVRGGEADNV